MKMASLQTMSIMSSTDTHWTAIRLLGSPRPLQTKYSTALTATKSDQSFLTYIATTNYLNQISTKNICQLSTDNFKPKQVKLSQV